MTLAKLTGVLLFGAVATVVTGWAGLLWYETLAYATGQDPTLSRILAYAIDTAPPALALWIGVTVALLVGVVGTVLAMHFTNLLSWWRP